MKKEPKPVLGYRLCPTCLTRGSIHFAGGRRNALYQRCECGCDQRTGKMAQSLFWYETDWLDGLRPEIDLTSIYTLEEFDRKRVGQVDRLDRADTELEQIADRPEQTESQTETETDETGLKNSEIVGDGMELDPDNSTSSDTQTGEPDPPNTKPRSGKLLLAGLGIGLLTAVAAVLRG